MKYWAIAGRSTIKITQEFKRLGIPLVVIFTLSAHKPGHNMICVPMSKKFAHPWQKFACESNDHIIAHCGCGCPRHIFSILSKSLIAFQMQCNSTYPVAGYPVAGYPVARYPVAGYPVAGYSVAGYPDRLRPSGKCVENSTKLTSFEITGCRIKYSTVLWLLELQLRRGREV